MKFSVAIGICVCLMLTTLAYAGAVTYPGMPEYSAGTGVNTANIVIDFGLSSYVFRYSWDGASTGWDAIHTIDMAGSLQIDPSNWGTETNPDYFVDSAAYPGAVKFDYGNEFTFWAYYTSDDGIAWTLAGTGPCGRALSDGAWDAWVWTSYAGWDSLRKPGESPVSTPEPTMLLMLGVGGLLLRRRIV